VERRADEPLDVICSGCGTTFCFNCKEEAHRPVRGGAGLGSTCWASMSSSKSTVSTATALLSSTLAH